MPTPDPSRPGRGELADLAETAARLCKADLVSATVGEFPEVQGIAGGHLALAEGLDLQIAAAIRDHYKPVGPSDEVPTAPVTVAVALAERLDTLLCFFAIMEAPTGSRDPFALRRSALSMIALILRSQIRVGILTCFPVILYDLIQHVGDAAHRGTRGETVSNALQEVGIKRREMPIEQRDALSKLIATRFSMDINAPAKVLAFLADRLKVQQRDAGVRPDIIDAVFALGGEDDLVRLLARVHALQAVLQTPDGISLLAGYKRGANILRIEEAKEPGVSDGEVDPDRLTEPAEIDLNAALDAAVPEVAAAVADERFESAMTALARLRPAVDAFFTHVTVNAADAATRRNRLALLARLRTAVHSVADFSKLDG